MEAALDEHKPAIPGFTYDEISCWRVFVQLFPESIRILDHASLHLDSRSAEELMSLSLLGSTLATSDDRSLVECARRILSRLKAAATASRLYSYSKYRVVREIRFGAAEAEGDRPADVIEFIRRHPLEWDLRLNREYYKDHTDTAHVRSTLAKLTRPRQRDLCTKPISEYFLERLPRKAVDEAGQSKAWMLDGLKK